MENVVFLIKLIPLDLNTSSSEPRIRIFFKDFLLKKEKKEDLLAWQCFLSSINYNRAQTSGI